VEIRFEQVTPGELAGAALAESPIFKALSPHAERKTL
jgi:hypothetical protein